VWRIGGASVTIVCDRQRTCPRPAGQYMTSVESFPMRASALGLPGFPGSPAPNGGPGDHIMGAVVQAWLTRHPVQRWGESWADRGSMRLRFREHLSVGTPLSMVVTHGTELTFKVLAVDAGADATLFADGGAGLSPAGEGQGLRPLPIVSAGEPVRPWPDRLRSLRLGTFAVGFDADRDLAFAGELADGAWWQARGWAHPAWLVTGANGLLRQAIAFQDGGYWRHAGIDMHQLRHISSGSDLVFGGHIDELFQGPRHRFAVARVQIDIAGEVAAVLRVTFVYGAALAEDGAAASTGQPRPDG